MDFFVSEKVQTAIKKCLKKNVSVIEEDESKKVRTYVYNIAQGATTKQTAPDKMTVLIYINNTIFDNILKNSSAWDKNTALTRRSEGEQYLSFLTSYPDEARVSLGFTYRVLMEYYLSCGKEIAITLEQIIYFIQSQYEWLDPKNEDGLKFTSTSMPILLYKDIFDEKLMETLSSTESMHHENKQISEKIAKYDDTWDEKLKAREVKIDALDTKLKKQQQGYNFVGLNAGFKRLSGEKKEDLKVANKSSSIWKGVSFCAPVLALIAIWGSSFTESFLPYYALIPFTTMFLLSLYYYRVALFEQKSLKAQLLQVDLRMSLCEFIQSYGEYSKEIKDNNGHSLDKFEDLIFSGLVANEDKLPTSLDGIDQLGKLIKAIKK